MGTYHSCAFCSDLDRYDEAPFECRKADAEAKRDYWAEKVAKDEGAITACRRLAAADPSSDSLHLEHLLSLTYRQRASNRDILAEAQRQVKYIR